ncbi:hypothetical protein EYC84_008271 [Monilinia fructicola]|uniref:Uncharacterized protein n=1 Tax=Monilinia fructicola TaxID=38448 RepID=A0A5M9JJA3_MONFR|nr:hypothetical protein EYC84_008271 [Monilinia fructicola]
MKSWGVLLSFENFIGIINYNFETIEQQLLFWDFMNDGRTGGCIWLSTVVMWCVNWRKDSPVWHDLETLEAPSRPCKKAK